MIERFPFSILELHPDTGNEFINNHLYHWTQANGICMTRSEPYKKNDNMCIEERNNSIARRHLGYVRLDKQSLVVLISKILKVACLIHNHFRPVRRMITKVRIGTKWQRTYEKVAKTPYQRILESEEVPDVDKTRLLTIHDQLDPFDLQARLAILKQELNKKLQK